jgi:outer membrane murein-binding lipoprotein Lpp
MRFTIFAFITAVAMLAGCSDTPQYMGAAVDNDQNVLTGGPITGTTIENLPAAVKQTLKERVPHAEIASIVKMRRDGKVTYEISFLKSENPDIYLRDDGKILPEPVRAQR